MVASQDVVFAIGTTDLCTGTSEPGLHGGVGIRFLTGMRREAVRCLTLDKRQIGYEFIQ